MHEFIILSVDGKFWDGTSWREEYPEAAIYRSLESAKAAFTGPDKTCACYIIQGYGLVTERVCYRSDVGGDVIQ